MSENNLDPEQMRIVNEALMDMHRSISMLSASLGGSASASARFRDTQEGNTRAVRDNTKSYYDEIQSRERWSNLAKGAGSNLLSLGNTALSTGTTLSKFGGNVDSVGKTFTTFFNTLGIGGKIIGLAIEAFTMVTKRSLEYGDNLLAAKDDLASFGAAGKYTSEEIMTFGKNAGYTSFTLKGWATATKSLGTDIIGLSATVNGGVAEFAKLSEVTMEQRKNYQAMGLSQEQVTQAQADSIKYMMKSGVVINDRMKADGTLKKMTLEYTDSLIQLAAITGQSVEEAKKTKEAALASVGVQIHLAELDQKEAALRSQGLNDEADKVKQEKKNTIDLLAISKTKMNAEQFAGFQQMVTTESFTDLSKAFANGNPGIIEFIKNVKSGATAAGMIGPELAKSTDDTVRYMGTAGKYSEEAAKAFNLSVESFYNRAAMAGKTAEEYAKELQKQADNLSKATKGETASRTGDNAQQVKEAVIDTTQAAQAKMDEFSKAQIANVAKFVGLLKEQAGAVEKLNAGINEAVIALTKLVTSVNDIFGTKGLIALGLAALFGPNLALMAGKGILKKMATLAAPAAIPAAAPAVGAAVPAAAEAAGAAGSAMSKVSKVAGRLAVPLAIGAGVYQAATGYNEAADEEKAGKITHAEGNIKKGGAIGEGTGTATGGIVGAIAGQALIPIPVVGALIGGIVGSWVGGKLGKEVGKAGADLLTDKKDKEGEKDVNMKLTGSFVEMTKVTLAFTKALKEATETLNNLTPNGAGTSTASAAPGGTSTASGGTGTTMAPNAAGAGRGNQGMSLDLKKADGTTEHRSGGTISWRNNNPGNLRYSDTSKAYGAIGESGGFAVFPDMETGEKARSKLLFESKAYRDLTIKQAINRYAPSTENDTDAYVASITKALGVDEQTRMDQLSAEQRATLLATMKKHEGFREGSVNGQAEPPVAQATPTAKPEEAKPPVAQAVEPDPIITITPTAEFKEPVKATVKPTNSPKPAVAQPKNKADAPGHMAGDKGGNEPNLTPPVATAPDAPPAPLPDPISDPKGYKKAINDRILKMNTPLSSPGRGASSEGKEGEADADSRQNGFAAKVKSILSMIDLSPKEARVDGKGTPSPAYPIKVTVPKSDENESAAETARLARIKKPIDPNRNVYLEQKTAADAALKLKREKSAADEAGLPEKEAKEAALAKEKQDNINKEEAERRAKIKAAIASPASKSIIDNTKPSIDSKTLLPKIDPATLTQKKPVIPEATPVTAPDKDKAPVRNIYLEQKTAADAALKLKREKSAADEADKPDRESREAALAKEKQDEINKEEAERRAKIKAAIASPANKSVVPLSDSPKVDTKTLLPLQKLAKGGVISNSALGTNVTLGDGPAGHREAAIPLDPSSIVHKLIQPGSAETLNKATAPMPIPAPVPNPMSDMTTGLTVEMVEMLSQKLDTMIDKLSSGNDTQDKILMYSRA